MVSSKVKQETAEINLISTGLNLLKNNVPMGAFWHRLGQVNFFGSSKTSSWFESLDSKLKDSLNDALVLDMQNMANEPLLAMNAESLSDRDTAIKISKSFDAQNPNIHSSGLPLLSFPLSLMNKKQKLKYLASAISKEGKKSNVGKVSFGEEESKPFWWLEEMWSWSNVNQSLHSIKDTMYTGEGTFDEFITKSMISLLTLNGMDPERDILSMEGKSNILAKKRRQRGIHEPPKVLENTQIGKVQPENNLGGSATPRLSSYSIRSTLSSRPGTSGTPTNITTSTPRPDQEQTSTPPPDQEQTSTPSDQKQTSVPPPDQEQTSTPPPDQKQTSTPPPDHERTSTPPQDHERTSTPPTDHEHTQYGIRSKGSSSSENTEQQITDELLQSPKLSDYNRSKGEKLNRIQREIHEAPKVWEKAEKIVAEEFFESTMISDENFVNKDAFESSEGIPVTLTSADLNSETGSLRKRKDYVHGFVGNKKFKSISTPFVKVPRGLESQLGDCMIQTNTGGYTSSLYKAAMQHINAGIHESSEEGFEYLQSFAHAKLVEWWPSFEHLFSFPSEVKVESKNNIRIVKIPDGEAFKKFLKSDESLYASLSKEVEIWILSYVLNTYIFLLTCDVHDQAVPGSALVGVPQWKTYAGTNVVSGLISPYTSNTNNLWLLIKDSDAAIQRIVINAEVESFERNLNVVVELVDGNDNLIKRKQKEKKSKKEPRTHIMTKERKEKLLRKTKGSKKKANTILRINSTKSKQVSETIKNIEDKNVATKSEIYYIFEIKQNKISIDDMPKIPTNSVREKELELDKLDLSIATSRAEFEKEMARVDRSIARERKRQSEFKERLVENSVRRDRLEKELSAPVLRGMFRKNKDYFMKIKCGEVKSLRHNEYFESGIKRDKLNFQKIVDPKTKKDISDNAEYMEKVMVSECFLKLYMDFFEIDDTKEAEQRILETPVDGDSDGELYL